MIARRKVRADIGDALAEARSARIDILLHAGDYGLGNGKPLVVQEHALDRVLAGPKRENPRPAYAGIELAPCLVVLLVAVLRLPGQLLLHPRPVGLVVLLIGAGFYHRAELGNCEALDCVDRRGRRML